MLCLTEGGKSREQGEGGRQQIWSPTMKGGTPSKYALSRTTKLNFCRIGRGGEGGRGFVGGREGVLDPPPWYLIILKKPCQAPPPSNLIPWFRLRTSSERGWR